MWFDARAALAKLEERGEIENSDLPPAIPAIPSIIGGKSSRRNSRIAGIATLHPENQKTEKPEMFRQSDDFKHGFSVTGSPLTWTGKVVSLAAWREFSEWERHGPDGRRFNGKSKEWETPI